MATLYFNAAVDNTWDNLLNWWQDNAFSTPATAIPADGDTVYLEANVNTGPSTAIALAALYLAQINNAVTLGNSGAGISTTGDLTVGKSTYRSGNNSVNLTIGGTAYLYGSSLNNGILTVTMAVFNSDANNVSTIEGGATFNGYSSNQGTVVDDATFNDSSQNASTVEGNATFNDGSSMFLGTVEGNATFHDNSSLIAGS